MFHNSSILKVAASPTYLAKGCVNVVELGTFKEHAGERWSRICEGVYSRLETLLRAKLGPNDLFVRIGEIAYLVTMPTTDPDDVNAICMRVAFDLHESFLGRCDFDQIQVSTVTSGSDDTLILQRLPRTRILFLAEKAGIFVQPPQNQQSSGSPNLSSFRGADETQRSDQRSGGATAQSSAALRVEHQFVQIWSAPQQAITTYACEPRAIFVPHRADSVPIAQLSAKERLEVEISAFKTGVNQLSIARTTGGQFLLAVPISFEVLGSPMGRMECLSYCHNLSQALRPHLLFIICDIPPGVAQTRLANLVNSLRPFGRSVSATIAPTTRAFHAYQAYEGIGLRAIGFNLKEFAPQYPFGQYDAEQLAKYARRFNLGTFMSGVGSQSILNFALDAQIQNLSGAAIAPVCETPHGIWRLTWGQLLSQPVVEFWD